MDLLINSIEISTDSEGRYSLNDLHKASGGLDRHRVTYFRKLDDVIELSDKILKDGNPSIDPMVSLPGRYGGTWVCKMLVLRYAFWISVDFQYLVFSKFMASEGIGSEDALEINRRMKNEQLRKMSASHHGRALQKHTGVKKHENKMIDAANKRLQISLNLEFRK